MIFMKDTTNNNDREIVSKILRGNEKALTFFYKENKKRLFLYIFQRVERTEDAEEILQDVFISAVSAFRDFTFKCSLLTFLFSIARKKLADFYRKKRIKAIVFSRFPGAEELISGLLEPDEEYEVGETKRRFYRILRVLKPKYQKLLRLKYIEGRKVAEIARIISAPVKSTESQIYRARADFKKLWENEKILTKSYLGG